MVWVPTGEGVAGVVQAAGRGRGGCRACVVPLVLYRRRARQPRPCKGFCVNLPLLRALSMPWPIAAPQIAAERRRLVERVPLLAVLAPVSSPAALLRCRLCCCRLQAAMHACPCPALNLRASMPATASLIPRCARCPLLSTPARRSTKRLWQRGWRWLSTRRGRPSLSRQANGAWGLAAAAAAGRQAAGRPTPPGGPVACRRLHLYVLLPLISFCPAQGEPGDKFYIIREGTGAAVIFLFNAI